MTTPRFIILLWLIIPTPALVAAPWVFDKAIEVSGESALDNRYFHHLDSSGRRNITVSNETVAIVWEDDRDNTPRIYLTYKKTGDTAFTHASRISGDDEAFEPSIVSLNSGRLVVAWEERGRILARTIVVDGELGLGPIVEIDSNESTQVSLTGYKDEAIAVWSQKSGRFGRIMARRLRPVDDGKLKLGIGCAVDSQPPIDDQLYPTAAISDKRLLVAWEDRRPKHTIIMAAVEQDRNSCRFSEPLRISEKPKGRNLPYGSGHGVSRVALDAYGEQGVYAAWADKRNFRDGYDIWGTPLLEGEKLFGRNEMIQDDFGGLAKQRHAAITGDKQGNLVVAWDDEREGDTDVVLSWRQNGEWSEDWLLPVASGEGQQSNPSIVLDRGRNIHITWVERQFIGGVTRIKYALGRYHQTE